MPTPLFVCGGECGVNAIGVSQPANTLRHWSALGAGVAYSTATTAGSWSFRSLEFVQAAPGTTDSATHTFASAIASSGTIVARFRFRISSLTDAQKRTIFSTTDGLAGVAVRFVFGLYQLSAWAGNATVVESDVRSLVLNQWHVIEVSITRGTTITTVCRVDGANETTVSKGSQTAVTIPGFVLGSNTTGTGGNTSTIVDMFIDDLCVSGTAADYPLNEGRVAGLWPSADRAHSFTTNDFAWPTAAGTKASTATDAWTALHNQAEGLTSTISDFVSQVVIRSTGYVATAYDDLLLQPRKINGLACVSEHHGSTTGAHTQSFRLINAADTESVVFALVDYSDITVAYNYAIFATSPFTSTAWTALEVNGLGTRWGFSTDVIGNPIFDGAMFEVDYVLVPRPVPPPYAVQSVKRASVF